MSQIDDAAAAVYRPLSSTAIGTRVVADAFALVVEPEEAYQESKVKLQKVEFAAFAVGGLAAGATAPEGVAVRASAKVDLPLADSAGGSATATQTVTLYGPGDVRGLDSVQIVRRFPAPGTLSAEETVLAHVEFDRPELPWQFSAAQAVPKTTLRPWLALIVVEKALVHWEPAVAMLPILNVPGTDLPELAQAGCWAHAQAPFADNAPSLDVRLSPEYANVNLSRLVSPRILKQDTNYIAAVVPILDVGIKTGLGLPGGSLSWGWSRSSESPVRLPVYDSWEFRTGPDGDFHLLALRLTGVVPPYEVGRRFVDASQPGKPLDPLAAGSQGARQVLRCALFSPTPPSAEQEPIENAAWPAATVDALHQALDLPAQIEGTQARTGGVPDLPIIGPRIYGAAHRGSSTVQGQDWFSQLNLAPMHRIVGGLGTRVVQRDQEQLMQGAWAQLGEVEKANEAIRLAQLAELLAERFHARLAALQPGRLLQLAAPLATRVAVNPGRTLAGDVADSSTPPAVLGGALRRVVRPGGPVVRRAAAAARVRAGALVGDGAALRDFTRLVTNPDGIGRLDAQSVSLFDADMAAQVLGGSAQEVGAKVAAASGGMAGGMASFLTRPAAWGAAAPAFNWAGQIASDWSERLQRTPADPTVAAIREQRIAPLAAELATSKTLAASPQRDQLVSNAVKLNNDLVSRLPPVRPGGTPPVLEPGRVPLVDPGGRVPHLDRPLAGHAIGGALTPRGGTSVRIAPTSIGRVGTRIPGISVIDSSRLTRLPTNATPESRDVALTALAGLAARPVTPVLDQAATLRLDDLRASLGVMVDPGGVLSIAEVPRRAPASVAALADVLKPTRTVRAALAGRLKLSDAIRTRWSLESVLRPIMAAPRFDRPMYEALNEYDRDWLVPGLGLLPADDFVTVLETNPEFVESFLVGLSDEMGRELLWRGYPTDRRGTYFWRFWDRDQDELKQPIHRFSATDLAKHVAIGGDGGGGPRAAIVIKSELVRRFPDLIIDVVRNQSTDHQHPEFETETSPQQAVRELFSAHLEPDIAIIGIDLSIDELAKPEWWILVAEHPSAIRFERSESTTDGSGFMSATQADNGATCAKRWLHRPTRVAFRATDLIRRA